MDWTIFYWAWWISWSPFVGAFIARVTYGRSVREFDRLGTGTIDRFGHRHRQSSSSSATARSTAATLPDTFGSG